MQPSVAKLQGAEAKSGHARVIPELACSADMGFRCIGNVRFFIFYKPTVREEACALPESAGLFPKAIQICLVCLENCWPGADTHLEVLSMPKLDVNR
jgi:hypothetical protein